MLGLGLWLGFADLGLEENVFTSIEVYQQLRFRVIVRVRDRVRARVRVLGLGIELGFGFGLIPTP